MRKFHDKNNQTRTPEISLYKYNKASCKHPLFHLQQLPKSFFWEQKRIQDQIKKRILQDRDRDRDEMTGFYNCLGIKKIDECVVRNNLCSVAYLDTDNFGPLNTIFGALLGDANIRLISQVLNSLQKKNPDTLEISRMGGEEFIIIGEEWNEKKMKSFLTLLQSTLKKEVLDLLERTNPHLLDHVIFSISAQKGITPQKAMDLLGGATISYVEIKRNNISELQTKTTEMKIPPSRYIKEALEGAVEDLKNNGEKGCIREIKGIWREKKGEDVIEKMHTSMHTNFYLNNGQFAKEITEETRKQLDRNIQMLEIDVDKRIYLQHSLRNEYKTLAEQTFIESPYSQEARVDNDKNKYIVERRKQFQEVLKNKDCTFATDKIKLYLQKKREIEEQRKSESFQVETPHFRSINNTFGHTFGDILLKETSLLIQNFFSSNTAIKKRGTIFEVTTEVDSNNINNENIQAKYEKIFQNLIDRLLRDLELQEGQEVTDKKEELIIKYGKINILPPFKKHPRDSQNF